MPINVGQLEKKLETDFEYEGQSMKVVFKKSAVDSDVMDAVRNVTAEGYWSQSCKNLAKIIVSWELNDPEGNPLPVTEEVLRSLDYTFVAELYNHILGALRPKKSSTKPSEGSFSESGN